jgi:hypothetical protein
MFINFKLYLITTLGILILCACSTAKLEARLEANPQCKDVINPKTGAVMPCPGTDKAFYRSVGLEPVKATTPVLAASAILTSDSATKTSSPEASLAPQGGNSSPQSDCKPQLHKKTGSMLPCPPSD